MPRYWAVLGLMSSVCCQDFVRGIRDVPLATFPVLVRSGAILRRGPAHLQKTPIATSESICAHMEGRRSITLQLVEHGQAAGQGEDQRLDGPGDIKTLAGRASASVAMARMSLAQRPYDRPTPPIGRGERNHEPER